jgi:methyl-accepting chemotaxis protein
MAWHSRVGKSLAFNFIFAVLVIFAIGQGTAWIWFLFTQKSHNYGMVTSKVETITKFLSDVSSPAIMDGDYTDLTRYCKTVLEDKDITYIKVTDARNNIVLRMGSGEEGALSATWSVNPLYIPWINKLKKSVVSGNKIIGSIEVAYNGKMTNELMFRLLTVPPIVEAAVFLLVIYFIYFFFQRQIGRPIGMLRERMERITDGDLTVEMPEFESIELGTIAKGMRFLVEGLASTVKQLNETAANVAVSVKEMNRTFGETMERIKRQSGSTEEISIQLRNAKESLNEISRSTDILSGFSSENVSSLLEVKATGEETALSMDSLLSASENSYSIVAQMSQNSNLIAKSARKVLESVENTSASVQEITASVREVERSAKDSARLSENVKEEAAHKGVLTVAEAVRGMERITEKVNFSVEIVRSLELRSKDIQKILSVIREITEQTNLLSLNAAILAEQAGEYGKGFAVVADEMRALSDRTAGYTKDIGGIVGTVQREIKEIVSSIDAGVEIVEEGSELVYKVGESMSSILESSHEAATMAGNIQRATEEQARSLDYVTDSMVTVNDMTLRMSRTMNEQLTSSNYMKERVGEVKEIADTTKKITDEQVKGTGLISKNFEFASENVESINIAVMGQQRVNDEIISSVDEIRSTSVRTIVDLEGVSVSMNRLQKEIDALRKEMGRFKT